MPTVPKNQTALANMLGIAKSAVSAQARRGMPTTTLEAAQAWRKENIDPGRKKGSRLDKYYQPRHAQQAQQTDARACVIDLMAKAAEANAAGLDIDPMIPGLRRAMAAVPPEWRDDLGELPMPVVRVLLRDVLAVLPDRATNPTNDDGAPFYIDGAELTDEEAQFTGSIWYQIAAGELVFDLDALAAYYETTAP